MKTPTFLAAAALLALSSCLGKSDADKPVRTPPVLAGVPIPDIAVILDTAGTADAARVRLAIGWPPDSVAAFYRRELPKIGFRLVGDVPDSSGTDLFAQRDGPSLWISVRPGRRPNTSEYTLVGAVSGAAGRGDSVPGGAKR